MRPMVCRSIQRPKASGHEASLGAKGEGLSLQRQSDAALQGAGVHTPWQEAAQCKADAWGRVNI